MSIHLSEISKSLNVTDKLNAGFQSMRKFAQPFCGKSYVFFYATIFFYVWLIIDPSLYYQCQTPVFVTDRFFLRHFLGYPGGLAEYLSNFFSQSYYISILGALIVTLCLAAVAAATKKIADYYGLSHSRALSSFASLLLLLLFHQYEHRLAITLGLIAALYAFILYLKTGSHRPFRRGLLIVLLSVVLYYFAAGYLLFFAVLCVLHEFLHRRTLMTGILSSSIAVFLPYFAGRYLFIVRPQAAYFFLLLSIYDYRPRLTPYLLLLLFPFMIIYAKVRLPINWRRRIANFSGTTAKILAAVVTISFLFFSFDRSMNCVLRIDQYAEKHQWNELLSFAAGHPCDDILAAFHINRALAHTNRMASEMFHYNQNWGASGLYLPIEARKFFSLQIIDFCLDMGLLNEARHWILEDHTRFENSPRHLQRLALVGLANKDYELARMALQTLRKTLPYHSWAVRYMKYIDNPTLIENDRYLQNLISRNVQSDFIINPSLPGEDIQSILAQNPNHRPALNYIMADYLLTFRLGEFMQKLAEMKEYHYALLPRHYQEAVLVFLESGGLKEQEIPRFPIERKTLEEFSQFKKILSRYPDPIAARKELKKHFGKTYWFYSLYNNPEMRGKLD